VRVHLGTGRHGGGGIKMDAANSTAKLAPALWLGPPNPYLVSSLQLEREYDNCKLQRSRVHFGGPPNKAN
jgi:hypothetical protein